MSGPLVDVHPPQRAVARLLVAFTDLRGFSAVARTRDDEEIARVLDGFYGLTASATVASGGRVVKFIGDGALLVWPESLVDEGVVALLDLRERAGAWLSSESWRLEMLAKAHFGEVVAGDFGPALARHYDVIGKTVDVAAKLDARTVSLTAETFRKLRPETRRLFNKHTEPVVYIPVGDPRP